MQDPEIPSSFGLMVPAGGAAGFEPGEFGFDVVRVSSVAPRAAARKAVPWSRSGTSMTKWQTRLRCTAVQRADGVNWRLVIANSSR
jgi:hypothetical protein